MITGQECYDATLGRWHSPDPLTDLASGITPYNYVLNNPTSLIDPDGMWFWESKEKRYQRQRQRDINRSKRQRDRKWGKHGKKSPNYNRGGYGRPVCASPDFGGTISMGPMLAEDKVNIIAPKMVPMISIPSYTESIIEPPLEIIDSPIKSFENPFTGRALSFYGQAFHNNTYTVYANERLKEFLDPIVKYMKINRNIKIKLVLTTNVDPSKGQRVAGINEHPEIAVNVRAYYLQQYISNTYNIPDSRIIISPKWNRVGGENKQAVEISLYK